MDTAGHEQDAGGPRDRLRFGAFDVDLRTGELFRDGELVRLQNQPFRVLAMLVSRPGELVTREELRREVWGEGTWVDFEASLNFCVRHIRAALGDQAASPRYVETLPRRGYRFIAPVEVVRAPAVAPVAAPPRAPRVRPWIALALVAVLAAAGAAWRVRPSASGTDAVRFQRITFRRGFVDSARFAPGGLVLYAAGWEGGARTLHVLNAATFEDQALTIDADEVLATTSAGEVLYRGPGGALRRVVLRGGTPKEIAARVLAADATADGNEIALARFVDGRVQVEFPAGQVVGTARAPSVLRISPDRRRLAYFDHALGDDDRGDLVVLEIGGAARVLARGFSSTTGLAWSPDGREVWFSAAETGVDSALHAVDLAAKRRLLAPAVGRLVLHDVLPDGRMLVERNTERIEARGGAVGGEERDLSWLDATLVADLSADGRRLLFVESGEGGGPDYTSWLRAVDGRPPVRLGPGRALALSPDEKWAACVTPRRPDAIQLVPLGSGTARALGGPEKGHVELAAFLPGERLAYATRDAEGRRRSFVRDLAGGPPRALAGAMLGPVSADELLVSTPEGPRRQALDGGPARAIPGLGRSRPVAFAGRDLVVRDPAASPAILELLAPDGTRRPFLRLQPPDATGVVLVGPVVLSDDARAYAYSLLRRSSDLYVVRGLR